MKKRNINKSPRRKMGKASKVWRLGEGGSRETKDSPSSPFLCRPMPLQNCDVGGGSGAPRSSQFCALLSTQAILLQHLESHYPLPGGPTKGKYSISFTVRNPRTRKNKIFFQSSFNEVTMAVIVQFAGGRHSFGIILRRERRIVRSLERWHTQENVYEGFKGWVAETLAHYVL